MKKKLDKNIFRKTEATLYDYQMLESDIDYLTLEIKRVIENYKGCTGLDMSKEKTGATHKFNSDVENEVIHREKEIRNLKMDLNNKKTLKEQIDSVVNRLNDNERKLIELRYLNRNKLTWKQVAYILGFNADYVCKEMRRTAIEKIGRTIFLDRCKQERFAI